MEKEFKKGSFCLLGTCLEVKFENDGAKIRCSAEEDKVIFIPQEAWETFIKSVKAGEFDFVNPQ